MRLASTLSLLAVMAFAVMAFATSGASAATVELDEEGAAAGTHCSTVTNNCTVHIAGDMTLQLPNMQVVTACTTEIVADFNENGSGVVRSVSFTGPACLWVNCPAPEGNWPISAMQETAGVITMTTRFCLAAPGPTQAHCNLPLRMAEDAFDPHHYLVTTNPASESQCPSGNWLSATFATESPHNAALYDEMEVEHDQG